MKIDLHVNSAIEQTFRVRSLASMFDVPLVNESKLNWSGEIPIEDRPWSVGLIVGPSGCGKSQILKHLFPGHDTPVAWGSKAVIDGFEPEFSMEQISSACSAVGFNTIPNWMRPFNVLSNGEQFRVNLARRILRDNPIVIDEYSSVVDRQVAQVASHAAQKYVRKLGKQMIAATCHYDVTEWLNPDWIFEPATMSFSWRSLRRRPELHIEIQRVKYEAWHLFSRYHYLSADLHKAARCFGLFVNGELAAFAGIMYRPHPTAENIFGISRIVTLPDFQGLGFAMVLADTLGSAYKAIGKRFHNYPAHPSFVRSHARSKNWTLLKKPGVFSPKSGNPTKNFGCRPCAVFGYIGTAMESAQAHQLLGM
jgi:hypothetical protein